MGELIRTLFGIEEPVYPYGVGEDEAPVALFIMFIGVVPIVGFTAVIGSLETAFMLPTDNRYGVKEQALNTGLLSLAIQLLWLIVGLIYIGL